VCTIAHCSHVCALLLGFGQETLSHAIKPLVRLMPPPHRALLRRHSLPSPPPPLTRSGASSHLAGGLARGDPPSSRLVGGLARRDPLLCLGLLPGARLLHRALLLRGLLGRWLLLCLGCRLCGDCG
jgi:hypothetical protein